ncbi:MAG: hypothetical protein HZC23_11625 [Rhodocyclales bacterium]|nr:hypothetical protein [Rhodocyclales bacterium]
MATPLANSVTDPPSNPSSLLDEAIRGLLQGGSWQFSGSHLLTYALHTDTPTYTWTAGHISAVAQAFAAWSAVADIQFQSVTTGATAQFSPADLAIVLSGQLNSYYPSAAAIGVIPDPGLANAVLASLGMNRASYPHPEGDVWLNAAVPDVSYSAPGGLGFGILLHEFGHALGLKHPHDDGGNGKPDFASLGIGSMDDGFYTVMSYNDPPSPSFSYGYQITPMPLDILAIQHIYGSNNSYHTGDDSYLLAADNLVRTLWDAGGNDSIVATMLPSAVTISLAEGALNQHGTYSYTAIAYNTTIENAVGSAFNDTLTGNAAANVLYGWTGADTMSGGAGDDICVVDNAGDVVIELPDEGIDSVHSSISYVLGANLEYLVLTGTAAINGTGNALNNVIYGNSAANIMAGGAGADIYVVDHAGDVVIEGASAPGENDIVVSFISYTLGANLEYLVLSGAAAINGTGNAMNNVIVGNAALNVMTGGAGDDVYFVDNAGDTVAELAGAGTGTDIVLSSVSYVLGANIEYLILTGTAAINGTGNAQNNIIIGNSAVNVLAGGAGDDILIVDSAGDSVTELAGGGTDMVQSPMSWVLGANFEYLVLTGTAAIDGTGNALNNLLIGNSAANVLAGEDGADTLIGGAGNDTLTGGAGNDTFYFNTAPGSDNVDSISDFASGDLVSLSASIFNGIGAAGGSMDAAAFVAGAVALDAGDRILYDQGAGALYYDADGSGAAAAQLFAQLVPGAALGADAINVVA